MTCRVLLFTLLCSACVRTSSGATIYEVPENPGNLVGAWDVNIFADDVHFGTASIISKIRMRLAIRGVQTCKLWLFTATNSAPIHTVSFTNVSAIYPIDVTTYDFDMQVQVPKDIYVGFSAEGDGWTNNADFWSRGTVLNRGVTNTAGQYYYGPVAGEKLTTIFPSGDSSFGCLQILSEPVQIASMGIATGHVHLAAASLPIYATNTVERCDTVGGTNWQDRGTLPLGVSSTTWGESNNAPTSSFYRVKSR
jgi:hypothetical protein